MSLVRFRFLAALAALALVVVLPSVTQAQFGKLIARAKAVRTSVDSARTVVDTTKTVITATKALVADGTTMSEASDSASDSAHAGGAKRSKTSATATGPSASTSSAGKTKRTTAASATTPAVTVAPAATRAPMLRITEPVYGQFTRGAAVQKALLKSNPRDAPGALSAAVSASGLTKADYSSVQNRVMLYNAYSSSNNIAKLNSPSLTAADIAVLNAHKSDIAQLMANR
ncbi:MAG TPA: hypothetical protein VII66_04350 [Gemmatimonadaceae bacterium]